jgi:hypothetical protein
LLLDDCLKRNIDLFATDIIPNLVDLVQVFREKQVQVETTTVTAETESGTATSQCPLIVRSSWSRTFDDGISNAMNRWYGPHGLRPDEPGNGRAWWWRLLL